MATPSGRGTCTLTWATDLQEVGPAAQVQIGRFVLAQMTQYGIAPEMAAAPWHLELPPRAEVVAVPEGTLGQLSAAEVAAGVGEDCEDKCRRWAQN